MGTWSGVLDHDRGTDSQLTLDIEFVGDSIQIHAIQTMPGGRQFPGSRTVVDVTEDGFLEFGFTMRAGVGMEVSVARVIEGGNRMVGEVQFRGLRIPEGATPPRISFDLRRGGSG